MSTESREKYGPDVAGVAFRLEKLAGEVEGQVAALNRRRKLHITVGSVLVAVCIVGLSNLTWKVFQLDAEALAQIGRHRVEAKLPESREAMQDYLKSLAPEVTSNLLAAVIGSIPQFRPLVLNELEDRLSAFSAQFESQLSELAESSVLAARADLNQVHPDATESKQVEVVVSAVAHRFTENIRTLLDALYPEYARELRQVEQYLVHLRDTDPTLLTPKERTEKEVITTFLRLIAREASASPVKG